jgi:hypothetical protein
MIELAQLCYNHSMLERLEVFFGDANNAAARVYARLASAGLPAACTLTGSVVGPTCEQSHTLTATIPFAARRAAVIADEMPPLLAEAIVPDPCFWSGELPFLYQAKLELRHGNELLANEQRPFGIRPLGALRRRLIFDGRPWVPRAVQAGELPEAPLVDWREADLAMYVEKPTEELCSNASRLGVVLIVEAWGDATSLIEQVQWLAKWPAVCIAVLRSERPLDRPIRWSCPNLLLAAHCGVGDAVSVPDWADLIVCEDASADELAVRTQGVAKPVLALRHAGWRDQPSDARRECDHLQRDLAGRGEFAGYVV